MHSVGAWNNLRRWIYKEGYAIKKGDGTKKSAETHLLLNGGRCAIPDAKNAEFLNVYARSLFDGDWLYLVEKKTLPVFHYMNEFDIKLKDREITREELDVMVRIIQEIMRGAFPGQDVRMAVCTAPPKPAALDDGTPVVQSGLHFIWRITVDGETAWQLRAWTLRALESGMAGLLPLATRWAEAFDDCIFEANGLRMIGSRKAIICPECKGQSYKNSSDDSEWGAICAGCQDVGRVDLGRPYSLLYVAGPDGLRDEPSTTKIDRDPMELVLFTSIRAINPDGTRPQKAMEITFPNPELSALVVADARRDKTQGKKSKAKKGVQKDPVAVKDVGERAKKTSDSLVEVSPDEPEYPAIAEYIRAEFNGLPNVVNIKKGGKGDVYIINSDCHYCYNKGGIHNHSSVFYILRPKGCVQRCFCPKDIVQPGGGVRCSVYVSKAHPVPSELLELIFTDGVLHTRRREERRAKLAAEVFASVMAIEEEEEVVHEAPAPQAEQPAVHHRPLPRDPRSVMVVRPGVEYKYKESRDKLRPRFTPADFLNATKSANYKIL